MKLDSKVKGGLAWAGLFVVLAVPAADMLIGGGEDNGSALTLTSDTSQVKTGTKTTVPSPAKVAAPDPVETASVSADPVENFVDSGKPLPDYISDGGAAPAKVPTLKPAAVKPAAPVKAPGAAPATGKSDIQTASVAPEATPPVPLPRSARPERTQVAAVPAAPAAAPAEKPLIIDENDFAQREASLSPPVDRFPLSDESDGPVIYGDELEEWNSGSLADYLERRGLISNGDPSAAFSETDSQYDPDGFFLDEGPNNQRPRRARRARDLDFFLF